MGVPALFRWLSAKYPKIIESVIEEATVDGHDIDLLSLNPNGIEYDNLYLDMNGIIHPCCHPEGKEAPENEEAMMIEIFKYIDRIFTMIRPRRLIYFAIDGVAPRAKMNQQRSRRFRAAQEAQEKRKKEAEEDAREELVEGKDSGDSSAFDSNCITPGTPFMELVAQSLRYYIIDRMNREPAWRQLKVILSDASVPGEGEHKIVDYIRKQRLEPNFDPNQEHVIYGLDADLIMLAMATHEARFHVLREDVFAEDKTNTCFKCGQSGHFADGCTSSRQSKDSKAQEAVISAEKPFIFLNIPILREYLEAELKPGRSVSFEFDLERAIDDWIFLCFFVGNDFLPHLPSMELREGAIDILINMYKDVQSRLNGYICDGGKVHLARAQIVMEELAKVEPKIFEKRQLKEERRMENINRRKQQQQQQHPQQRNQLQQEPSSLSHLEKRVKFDQPIIEIQTPGSDGQSGKEILEQQRLIRLRNIEAARAIKAGLDPVPPQVTDSASSTSGSTSSLLVDLEAPSIDLIKLWESGARERYYVSKFNIKLEEVNEFAKGVAKAYVEGLCWVLAYYYRGCGSWKWYYPYHYAPFAADLVNIADLDITFELGEPFRPFDQLMAVFPAASKEHIPTAFHRLMTSHESEIIDFYPDEFEIDMNGKRATWQGVALLPFIDEERLLNALNSCYPHLTEQEKRRNARGVDLIVSSKTSSFGLWLVNEALQRSQHPHDQERIEIPDNLSPGGQISANDEIALDKTLVSHLSELPNVHNSLAVSVNFYPHPHTFSEFNFDLLTGVKMPRRQLTDEDVHQTRSGASGQNFPNILSYGNGRQGQSHSMHRDSRDQMQRSDGVYRAGQKRPSSENSHSDRSYRPSRDSNHRRDFTAADDRFSEYGNANVPGPYDLPAATQNSSSHRSSSYSSRYTRR